MRYSEQALKMLREIKQRRDENVQCYAERLLSLASGAFNNQPGGVRGLVRQKISCACALCVRNRVLCEVHSPQAVLTSTHNLRLSSHIWGYSVCYCIRLFSVISAL